MEDQNMEKWKDKPLNPESLPVVVKACEEAFVYVNELLIDNAVDVVSGKKSQVNFIAP